MRIMVKFLKIVYTGILKNCKLYCLKYVIAQARELAHFSRWLNLLVLQREGGSVIEKKLKLPLASCVDHGNEG